MKNSGNAELGLALVALFADDYGLLDDFREKFHVRLHAEDLGLPVERRRLERIGKGA